MQNQNASAGASPRLRAVSDLEGISLDGFAAAPVDKSSKGNWLNFKNVAIAVTCLAMGWGVLEANKIDISTAQVAVDSSAPVAVASTAIQSPTVVVLSPEQVARIASAVVAGMKEDQAVRDQQLIAAAAEATTRQICDKLHAQIKENSLGGYLGSKDYRLTC